MFGSIGSLLGIQKKKEEPPPEPIDAQEFFEGLDAGNLDPEVASKAACQPEGSWFAFDDKHNVERLNRGDSLFSFMCSVGGQTRCGESEQQIISNYINLTSFQDELEENNVPPIDILNEEEAAKYTIVMTRAGYLMKDVEPNDFVPEMYGIGEYHKVCQPGGVGVSDEVPDDTTFRITKTFISLIWKMTLQMKCSLVEPVYLEKLSRLEGFPIKNAILMERTKRNKSVIDATRKVKSVLIFSPVKNGVLVQMTTMVFNSVVPSYASKVIHNLGSFGSGEVADTATLTRKHGPKFIAAAKQIVAEKEKDKGKGKKEEEEKGN